MFSIFELGFGLLVKKDEGFVYAHDTVLIIFYKYVKEKTLEELVNYSHRPIFLERFSHLCHPIYIYIYTHTLHFLIFFFYLPS